MKKVININFQGRVIPIEEKAYDLIQQYIESLRNHFANEEGREEIIGDIEDRIAELFAESLKKGATCITEDDVHAIINSIGRPEDFDSEDATMNDKATSGQTHEQQQRFYGPGNQKLFRSENDKIIAGVCSGIANYFNVEPWLVRILFLIFFGMSFVVYIVLWVTVPSTASKVIGSARKRLFRNPDDKIIAGVCSGLAQYFGVSTWIPRIIFLIPFISFVFKWSHWGAFSFPHFLSISFSPGATIMYIILWLVLPEAKTVSEKLEMKGEKVDLNSIKNTVTEDMKGFQERLQKMGQEASEYARRKSKEFGGKPHTSKAASGLGDVIATIVKFFIYAITILVCIVVAFALFTVAIVLTGLLPIKDYIITEGYQNLLAWITLILFVWIPVVGFLTFIIRRLAGRKHSNPILKYSFSTLWLTGLASALLLTFSLIKDFKYTNKVQQDVVFSNNNMNRLEVTIDDNNLDIEEEEWLNLEPFSGTINDSVKIKNIHVRILKSPDSMYHSKMVKISQGKSRSQALKLAEMIDFTVEQRDSTLYTANGFFINNKDKFRNQRIELIIYVPVGKRIFVNSNIMKARYGNVHLGVDNGEYRDWDNEYEFSYGKEYIMTDQGLELSNNEKDFDNNDNNEDMEIRYRYKKTSVYDFGSMSTKAFDILTESSSKSTPPETDLSPVKSSLILWRF